MLLSLNKDCFRKGRRLCVYRNNFIKGRKTLFFIHDLGQCAATWQSTWRHLSDRYNVIAYDMIGHGMSDAPASYRSYSISEQIFDAQAVFERYKTKNMVLLGHGYGAIIGLLLAKIYTKEVCKVVFVTPDKYEGKPLKLKYRLPVWGLRLLFLLRRTNHVFEKKAEVERLFLPKPQVIKYYNYWRQKLPNIDVSSINLSFLMMVSRLDVLMYKLSATEFYTQKLPLCKCKYLDSDDSLPMISEMKAVNYYLDGFLDTLDIKAFRNLVFEGAGIRGIAYAGTLLALNSMGVLEGIKRVAGSSAGAIYATFLAVGYTAAEIYHIVQELDFSGLTGNAGNILSTSTRFLSDYGWYKGDAFAKTMGELIARKTGSPNTTFEELHRDGGLEIYIVGTNLSKNCPEVYSYEATPKMSICEAVRISTSIPLLFQAVRRKDEQGNENVLIDGGVSWNYPIDIFDYHRFMDKSENAESCDFHVDKARCFNHESLGFRLDPLIDPLHSISEDAKYQKISNVIDFGKSFMRFVHAATMKRHLYKRDWNRTIYVNTLDIGGTDFDITPENKNRLIEEGKEGVHKHFSWRLGRDGLRFPQ